MGYDDIQAGKFVNHGVLNFYDLPWLDISTIEAISNILQGIKKAESQRSPDILGYFMHLAEIQPDPAVTINIFRYIAFTFEKLGEKHVTTILTAASKGLTHANTSVRSCTLYLFAALVNKEQAYKEALAAASNGLTDASLEIVDDSLHLFKTLVDKGQAYQEALAAASHCLTGAVPLLQFNVLNVFIALIYKGQASTEPLEATLKCLGNANKEIQISGIKLLKPLWEKGTITENKMAAMIRSIQDKVGAQMFFDSIKSDFKDTKIKEDLEQYFSQP